MNAEANGGSSRLEDILITDQLKRRPQRAPDFAAESAALRSLALEMATRPQGMLQKLVDTAQLLTRADSAGISILEDDHGTPIFRWRAIAGAFAHNVGGQMPRNNSPCGEVVDSNAPLLLADPARHYPALANAEPAIVENLLVPFHIDGRPVGTVWAISHSERCHFDSEDLRLLESLSSFAGAAWQMIGALKSGADARASLERSVEARTRELTEAQRQLAAEMAEISRLHDLASRVLFQRDERAALQEILEATVELQGADCGDVQLFDPERGELQLVAHHRLDDSFIQTLKRVNNDPRSASRRALASSERVTLTFEAADAAGPPAGALDGLRAVTATPLVTRGGDRLGVMATYFRREHRTAPREQRVLDLYARHAGDAIERLQAEETLQASEEKFRLVVQSVQDHAIILLDTSGGVVSWNEGAQRMLGYTADEVVGSSAARFMTQADLERGFFERELNTAATTGRFIDENWMVRKDGTTFWASGTSTALRRANGQLTGYAKIFRDLTERKATEDALREKDLRLRAALSAGRMGTWRWDVQTDRHTIDDSMTRLIGIWPGQSVDTLPDFLNVVVPDDRPQVSAAFNRSVQHGDTLDVEFRVQWPDGSVHWLKNQGDVFYAPDWRPLFMTGACIDITERKHSEAALAVSERRQRLLAASATRLLAEPNPEALLRQTLAEAAELLGLDSWFGHLATEDGVKLKMATCGGIEEAMCGELQLIDMIPAERDAAPDHATWIGGIEQNFSGMAARIGLRGIGCRALHARGKLIGMICLGSRTLEQLAPGDAELLQTLADQLAAALARQRAEAALMDADRRKDEFLAMLSHELRNPLAPLRTAMELVRRKSVDDETRERMFRMIDRQLTHLTRLVDDLLDVSRITRGKIELRRKPLALTQVIDLAIEMAAGGIEQRRHRLKTFLPSEPLYVEGDATRLTQVIFNLLSNSAKYTDAGGEISISAGRDDHHVVVQVSDNGIGMPPELVPRVFDLFTQGERLPDRAQGGLGLGLTLVRQLVELHQGTVHAESDGVGKGSCFTVRLPLVEGRLAEAAKDDKPASVNGHVKRVLIVDDNIDAAEATMLLLANRAQDIALAHSGVEALEVAREFLPDLVLLDIGLPGMDGYEVARRLRAEPALAHAMIAAVTGYGQPTDRQRTQQAGFDEHLVKPVSMAALNDVLHRASQRRSNVH